MVKRRKQTPAERAYSKQVKRIKQFISRAEKRGYQFSADVLPQRPKLVTQASVRKLANLTPEKLYQKAVYGGLATEGEIVPAIDALKLERSLRARKALETRKYNLSHPTQQPTNTPGFVPPERSLRAKKASETIKHRLKESAQQPTSTPGFVPLERSLRAKKASETIKHRLKESTQQPTNTPGFVPPENISEDGTFFENVVISQWYATLAQFSNGEAYGLLRTWMGNTVRTEGKHNTAIMLQDGAENGHLLTWEVVYKHDNAVLYIGYMIDYLPDEDILYKEEMLDKVEFMKRMGDALEQDEDWEYPL